MSQAPIFPPDSAVWVACPQCATQLPCHDPASSRYFGCGKCRTFFWTNPMSEVRPPRRLGGFRPAPEASPGLPLGAVGELGGYRCRLTGYQVRGEKRDPTAEWCEYQLRPATPLPGPAPADFPLQLAEYQGHWLLIKPAPSAPDTRGPRSAQDGSWVDETGRCYAVWHRYSPLIRDAVGEFDYNLLADEALAIAEYVSPPYLLVSEQPPDGPPDWYLAEYLEPAQVATALGVAVAALPPRRGVGAAQPGPTQSWPHLRRLALVAGLLLTLGQLALVLLQPRHPGEQQFLVMEPDLASYQKVVVSKSFEVAGPSALAVTLEVPDLLNHWVEVTASLVNEQTGRGYEFTRSIEYYEGQEDGTSWTEGSRTVEAVLSAVPTGRYHLNLYPTLDKGTGAVDLQLRLEAGTLLWSNYLLLLGVLALWPLAVWARRRSFEQARWAGSDYSPYATTD